MAARSHPSVITHSVANELSFTPRRQAGHAHLPRPGAASSRGDLDPTLPISVDIKGRPGYGEQFTYERFDLLGINQYFGWYRWVAELRRPRAASSTRCATTTRRPAMVMTEFGAEARPELANAPGDR